MARQHTSFVLAYHGCTAEVGEKILAGQDSLQFSERDYDWLGPGVYFWEADPVRAWEWAEDKVRRLKAGDPFVIGAAIDLGNCLDLVSRESLELVRAAYDSLLEVHQAWDEAEPLPQNLPFSPGDEYKMIRKLDCAVIRRLHTMLEQGGVPPYDSVRGIFQEGLELYPDSGFKRYTHTQIAIRDLSCIKGCFRVEDPRKQDVEDAPAVLE